MLLDCRNKLLCGRRETGIGTDTDTEFTGKSGVKRQGLNLGTCISNDKIGKHTDSEIVCNHGNYDMIIPGRKTDIRFNAGFFQNLMIAYYAPDKNDPQNLAGFLGLRSTWGTKDYLAGLRNYTAKKTLQIVGKLREIDAKSKGLDNPNTDAGDLMKELIFFILH